MDDTGAAGGRELKVLASGLQFPEGPIAMRDGSVVFVEMAAGRLSRWRAGGPVQVIAVLGGGPNGAAIGPDGHCYVCNNGGYNWGTDARGRPTGHGKAAGYVSGRIERVDMNSGKVECLYDSTERGPLSAPNDIVFDAEGGFWFTDLGWGSETHVERGRVCYAKADGSSIREVVFPLLGPNGIGLAPGDKTLYVAETLTARLWAFEITEPGRVAAKPRSGRMLFASERHCLFDSLAVEADGNICVATVGVPAIAGITVIAPDGKLVERVSMPDVTTTNICFGGAQLRTAYVTLSQNGELVSSQWPRAGLQLPFL